MTNEQIIKSWKNPEVKSAVANPAGETMQEISNEELARINGGGDVQPETTPFCAGVVAGITISLAAC